MKIVQHLLNALSGWIAGVLVTLGFSYIWQQIFPVIDRTGQGSSLPAVLAIILIIITPVSIAGGVIGGRLPRESGRAGQLMYAALFGALFAVPFACFLFWYLGW